MSHGPSARIGRPQVVPPPPNIGRPGPMASIKDVAFDYQHPAARARFCGTKRRATARLRSSAATTRAGALADQPRRDLPAEKGLDRDERSGGQRVLPPRFENRPTRLARLSDEPVACARPSEAYTRRSVKECRPRR